MATYTTGPDRFAGWQGAGRQFAAVASGSGAIGGLCWIAAHGGFGQLRAASDQIFISIVLWVSLGLCALMSLAALGSLVYSVRSRGIITVDDIAVHRRLGRWHTLLRWEEIGGSLPSIGGVTLVSVVGNRRLEIPRSLDDFRGCLAEIRAHNPRLQTLERRPSRPARSLLRYFALYLAVSGSGSIFHHHSLSVRLEIALVCLALLGLFTLTSTRLLRSR